MKMCGLSRIIATILLLGLGSFLHADIIHMVNGDRIKGKIVSQDQKNITIKTKFTKLVVLKSKVARIEKEVKPKEYINVFLRGGSIYRGVVIKQNREFIMIRRVTGEKKIFLKENVVRLDWGKGIKEKIVTQSDKQPTKRNIVRNNPQKKGDNKHSSNQHTRGVSQKSDYLDRFAGMTTGQLRWQSTWRSALLPSWGQFYQGNHTKGWIFASAMGISLLGMLYSYVDYQNEKDKWNDGDRSQAQYDRMEKSSDLFFVFSLSALSVWVLNVLDAAIFSPELPGKRDFNISFAPDPRSGAFSIFFEKRF